MQSLDDCLLPEYTQYIENENESLPAFAIHKHAKNGYSTTRAGAKVCLTLDYSIIHTSTTLSLCLLKSHFSIDQSMSKS